MSGFYLSDDDEFDPSADDFVPEYLLPVTSKDRAYKHFDLVLSPSECSKTFDFSSEKTKHRFFPLLGFDDITRKFSCDVSGKKFQTIKKRPIRYAGHKDSFYLQAYAAYLNGYYEKALLSDGISESVIAYRKGGGTNIYHAKNLFDEIRRRKNCIVVTMDISSFFDNINHIYLRDELCKLLGVYRLNSHHLTVWKNLTKYSWVETNDLDLVLGRKRMSGRRICSVTDYAKYVRGGKGKKGLIQVNDEVFGIPQGTPISGLYANIYLRTFDNIIVDFCKKCGGFYRRYSDDIAVVLPENIKPGRVMFITEKLLADIDLSISVKKTEFALFMDGALCSKKPIQYLGFTFDGKEILLRASSIDSYRRKMKKGIHAKIIAAKMKKITPDDIFKRELLSRYTHLGKRRNFIKYAFRSADIMNSESIRAQVRKHFSWFQRAWKKEIKQIYKT